MRFIIGLLFIFFMIMRDVRFNYLLSFSDSYVFIILALEADAGVALQVDLIPI